MRSDYDFRAYNELCEIVNEIKDTYKSIDDLETFKCMVGEWSDLLPFILVTIHYKRLEQLKWLFSIVDIYDLLDKKSYTTNDIMGYALYVSSIEVLDFLDSRGFKIIQTGFTTNELLYTIDNGDIDRLEWIYNHITESQWEEFQKYEDQQGCPLTWALEHSGLNDEATRLKHVSVIKFLCEKGWRICLFHIDVARDNGQLENLKSFIEVGRNFDRKVMMSAVERGDFEAVEFLHSVDCPVSILEIISAQQNGFTKIANFIRNIITPNYGPFDENTIKKKELEKQIEYHEEMIEKLRTEIYDLDPPRWECIDQN